VRTAPWLSPVHPRVRGEQYIRHVSCLIHDGSSPRARGTGVALRLRACRRRFIPACAGNRPARRDSCSTAPVHPRVRGEQAAPAGMNSPSAGSSPRARGTVVFHLVHDKAARFIPACAGNSFRACLRPAGPSVHPRVRGEQAFPAAGLRALSGSSPRARGTGLPRQGRHHRHRFIPACAGNSATQSRASDSCTVHPRVRGEQIDGHGVDVVFRRFIPACAGNRSRSALWVPAGTVHPRVRGEQADFTTTEGHTHGSSPRARGTDFREVFDF